jgi:hypothetical protein
MSFVAVDLGASSSRHVSDSGQITVTPNYITFLSMNDVVKIQPDAADIHSSLEIIISKDSGEACEHFPAHILMGIMADRFSNMSDRPSVQVRKCLQRVNYISAIVTAAINKLSFGLDDNIDLYLAVPPIEINDARDMFSKGLIGTYTVTFPKYMGGTQVNMNIQSVQCYEESYMASTSFFFNMNGVIKEQNKKYLTGNVLSLDIGASTTDLAIIKDGRYLEKTGQTYRAGGNEVRDYVQNMVCARYDMELSVDAAEKCITEGRLQQGNSYVDVSDILADAKAALAKKLMNHLEFYFKRIEIDIKLINAIIVSGGGSVQSQYVDRDGNIVKTSEPMSYYVTKELTAISSGTDVVAYGDEARFANVKGLFIRAKLQAVQKAQQAAQLAAQQAQAQAVQAQVVAQPVQVQPQVAVATQEAPVMTQVNG